MAFSSNDYISMIMKRMSKAEPDSTSENEPSLFWTKDDWRAFERKRKRLGRLVFWASFFLGAIFFRDVISGIQADLLDGPLQEGFRGYWINLVTRMISWLLIATLLSVVSKFAYTYVETGEFGD